MGISRRAIKSSTAEEAKQCISKDPIPQVLDQVCKLKGGDPACDLLDKSDRIFESRVQAIRNQGEV